ncbi:hypothetical protein [Marinobacter sp. R17]|uniref:hypothetical protein n=1 Tax=Marinobacter sp. R17 TaxID=2484250 RepID=UPI000F4CC766|nr:hypothetical protein [Marinobacter sp. R17]
MKTALEVFLSEDCSAALAKKIRDEIALSVANGDNREKEFISNTFNIYIDVKGGVVHIEDDLDYSELQDSDISLEKFMLYLEKHFPDT